VNDADRAAFCTRGITAKRIIADSLAIDSRIDQKIVRRAKEPGLYEASTEACAKIRELDIVEAMKGGPVNSLQKGKIAFEAHTFAAAKNIAANQAFTIRRRFMPKLITA